MQLHERIIPRLRPTGCKAGCWSRGTHLDKKEGRLSPRPPRWPAARMRLRAARAADMPLWEEMLGCDLPNVSGLSCPSRLSSSPAAPCTDCAVLQHVHCQYFGSAYHLSLCAVSVELILVISDQFLSVSAQPPTPPSFPPSPLGQQDHRDRSAV